MSARLQRMFRVLPDEAPKLASFALLAALLQAGVAVGVASSDALFVARLGVGRLPYVYVFMPLIMAVYAPLCSVLLTRLGADRLFFATLGVLAFGGVAFALAGSAEPPRWLLFAMKFYTGLWFIALYSLFWNFADDYFSILDGKRLYGLIAAGAAAGGMAGAALVAGLSRLLPPAHLFLAWSALALATVPVFAAIRRRFPRIKADDEPPPATSSGRLLRFLAGTLRRSRFALALSAICFALVNLGGVLEFLSYGILAEGRDAAGLAGLLGHLYAVASAVTLVINLFFFNRVVGRIGVGNTALLVPLAYLGAFGLLCLRHDFATAIVGFYVYQSLLVSIEYNNVNLLFNALPAAVKKQLRTFIEAMCEPLATALAGVFLLLLAPRLGVERLAFAGLVGAGLAVVVALFVRHDYGSALAGNLRRDWLDFSRSDRALADLSSPEDRELLRARALSGQRPARLVAVVLLWRLDDPRARDALLRLVRDAGPDEVERLRPVVTGLLDKPHTETLAEMLLWLESEQAPASPEVLDIFTSGGALPARRLHQWRYAETASRLALSSVALWRAPALADTELALSRTRRLLDQGGESRRWAIHAVGDFGHTAHAGDLYHHLDDPDPAIRLETLRALRKLATPDSHVMLSRVLPRADDTSPEERQIVLSIAERVGDTAAVSELLRSAERFSTTENRRLENIAVGLGLKAVPAIIHLLRDTSASYHTRSVAARALGRVSTPQLLLLAEDLVDTELRRALDHSRTAEDLHRAHPAPLLGLSVLTRYYRDTAAEGLEFILELLSLVGRLPDFDLIRSSLAFANPKDQANAVETIQQNCPREVFRRLLPLILASTRSGPPSAPAADAPPLETLLRRAATGHVPIESASALLAIREHGVPDGRDLLRRQLDASESPRLIEWLVALLPRFGDFEGDAARALHPVEKVAALVRAPIFAEARILALDYMASKTVERFWPAGDIIFEPGQAGSDFFLVVEGSVDLRHPRGAVRSVPAGSAFGERVLMGETTRRARAVSAGARGLVLDARTVRRAIEIYPALGISLFKFKTVAAFR